MLLAPPARSRSRSRPPGPSFGALAAVLGARKMEDYGRFLALLGSALLVGFVSVVFSLVWVFHYREGLSWDGSPREFNWHPVLIITGFVFIQGIGASGDRARGWHGAGRGRRGAGRPAAGDSGSRSRLGKPALPGRGTKSPL